MKDLFVNLYEKDYLNEIKLKLKNEEVKIKRLLSPNSDNLIDFVTSHFNSQWASEVKAGAYKENPTCFIATHENEIVGFACYDATAKGYFGPTGVNKNYRGQNIGQLLLLTTLNSMKEAGYGYAVIGSVGKDVVPFYSKYLNVIESNSKPNIYSRMI